MPHDFTNGEWRLRRRIYTVMFTCRWAWPRARRFVRFWAYGEQSSQKFVIPCLGRRWTAVQNVTPLALSSAEKSVTIETNTQTNKIKYVRFRGRPYIHTCRSYVHTPNKVDKHAITLALPTLKFTFWWMADFVRFFASGGAEFPKIEDSMSRTPMNHHRVFDILALYKLDYYHYY